MTGRKTGPSIMPLLLFVGASFTVGILLLRADDGGTTPRTAVSTAGESGVGPSRHGTVLLPPAELTAVRLLRVAGITRLAIVLGAERPALTAEDEAARVSVRVSKDGRRLVVEGPHRSRLFGDDGIPHLSLALPRLERLDIDGASNVRLSGPVGDLKITIDGAADVTLAGPGCDTLDLRIDGAAMVDAAKLSCDRVTVAVDGAAHVVAFASQAADVGLDGVGAITIHGRPHDVRVDKDGIGRIRFPDRDTP